MNTLKGTIVQFVILGVAGIAVGLGVNSVRGSIDLGKNYFYKGPERVKDPPLPRDGAHQGQPDEVPDAGAHIEHDYQKIDFEGVVEIFEDPATAAGANVIVDARPDAAFEEGHIPGAFQADHYKIQDYIDNLLPYLEGAEKIIVYCEGGDCEDSIFLCTDLVGEFDIPYDNVYLYGGGFKEWKKKDMPIETGRGE